MILLIGWRGEIVKKNLQVHDEPQHLYQGKITLKQLELIDIPYKIIDKNSKDIVKVIKDLKKVNDFSSKPVAIVVKKELLENRDEKNTKKKKKKYKLSVSFKNH